MVLKRWLPLVAVVLLISGVLPVCAADEKAPAPKDVVPADYTISAGDVLDISVWKDEALTRTLTVLPDGKINFPLIGDFTASGKTVNELKEEMKSKLSRYIPDPILYVDVRQVSSLLIYVIGRVNQPGRFVLNINVNVLQALSMAGGLNPYAKRNKIKIFRQENDKTKIMLFRYDDVTDGGRLEDNIWLKKGDVIVVP